jgi:hypothetical protein
MSYPALFLLRHDIAPAFELGVLGSIEISVML